MDIDKYISILKDGKCLREKDVYMICEKVKEILVEESNIQPISAPVTICGNVHGQLDDVLELFRIGGDIPKTSYIFMGGFIDKGYQSVETLSLLLCLKLKYPTHITLLRGSHETRSVSQIHGFHSDIMRHYGNQNCWNYFNDLFDYFVLGAIIEESILCVSGGLSPDIKTLDQVRIIDRIMEIPPEGPMIDLMWSDPDEETENWKRSLRGIGWYFGGTVTKEFNYINQLELIARGHQMMTEGYKYYFKNQNLVTIWSAPNFAYRCGNLAAIMQVDANLERKFKTFSQVPESSSYDLSWKNLYPNFN